MVSPVQIITLPAATTAQRDAEYTGKVAVGIFFNLTTGTQQITFDTGANWFDVVAAPEGATGTNEIAYLDNNGNLKSSSALQYNDGTNDLDITGLAF